MRLYTFENEGQLRLGAEWDGRLIDLERICARMRAEKPAPCGGAPRLPSNLLSFLGLGQSAIETAQEALDYTAHAPERLLTGNVIQPLKTARLKAPLPRPGKVLCSGINYRGHLEENPTAKLPEEPFFFAKMPSVVIGPADPIVHPAQTKQLDYEVEFAAVIGRRMKDTPESAVMNCVAGYTILHDVSARDVQFKDGQITLGKNFDTFCPLGPCLVTRDELPDPGNCSLRTYLNGRLMQDGTTSDWVFTLPRLLAFLSGVMTLEPGDVVSTGTPAGVGLFRKPQVFLKPGDVVRLEIDGIGILENPVVAG